jgi:hypothetical protein
MHIHGRNGACVSGEKTMNAPESKPLNLAPECADLLADACAEIDQLARMVGTWPDDPETLLGLRGLAIRLRDLNGVLGWALFRDGSFNLEEASQTVRGPDWWRRPA